METNQAQNQTTNQKQVCCSGGKTWLMVLVIVIAFLAGGIVYALQQETINSILKDLQTQVTNLQNQVMKKNIPADGDNTNPATDETANWKTYINSEYGYNINYPENWDCKIFSDFFNNGTILDEVFCSDKQLPEKRHGNNSSVSELNNITIWVSTEMDIASKDYLQQRFQSTPLVSEVFVDGVKSTKVSGTVLWDGVGLVKIVQVSIPKNGKKYIISVWGENNLSIFNKILSTFKFTK